MWFLLFKTGRGREEWATTECERKQNQPMLNFLQGVIWNKETGLAGLCTEKARSQSFASEFSADHTGGKAGSPTQSLLSMPGGGGSLLKMIQGPGSEKQQPPSAETDALNVRSIFSTCTEGLNPSVLKFMVSIFDASYWRELRWLAKGEKKMLQRESPHWKCVFLKRWSNLHLYEGKRKCETLRL